MSIVRMDTLLKAAAQRRQAIPAFECWDSNTVQAIARAAQRTATPVIFQASAAEYGYCGGAPALKAMVQYYVNQTGIDAALHLDHGQTLQHVQESLEAGFSSVMLDGSTHPYEENVRLTRATVEMAQEYNASVEGELGQVGGLEAHLDIDDDHAALTDPEQVASYVAETGLDCLAVAIGTVHGIYHGEPRIDLDRLQSIAQRVSTPLVLHGGSGTPDHTIRQCIRLGISKINICTELQQAWLAGLDQSRAVNPISLPGKFYTPVQEELIERMIQKITLFTTPA